MGVRVRVSEAADLLPLIPYLLGFQVHRSGVVLALTEHETVGLTARWDLPDTVPDAVAAAEYLVPVLAQDWPAGVLVVGYEDEPGEARLFVDTVVEVLARSGLRVVEALVVREGRWRRLTEPGPGIPLPTLPQEAELVRLHGCVPLPDRAAMAAQFRPTPAAATVGAVCDRRRVPTTPRGWRETADAWAQVLDVDSAATVSALPAEVLATAAVGLRDVGLRDALLSVLVPSLRLPEPTDALALLTTAVPPIEPSRVDAVWERLREMSTCLPDQHAAPTATLLAAMAWAHGEGAQTWIALDRARAAEPDYPLAALLAEMVHLGLRFPQP